MDENVLGIGDFCNLGEVKFVSWCGGLFVSW